MSSASSHEQLQVIAVCDAYDFGTPASQPGPGVDHETRDRRARERLDAAVATAETA